MCGIAWHPDPRAFSVTPVELPSAIQAEPIAAWMPKPTRKAKTVKANCTDREN